MKPTVIKKIAQMMALMMLISILVPVIAFGATTVSNVKFSSNGVTADVYTDVYNSTYGNISLNVYGDSGATLFIGSVNAAPTVNGTTYYTTITVPVSASVYNTVYLVGSYNNVLSSVYMATYSYVAAAPTSNPVIVGGGGVPTDSTKITVGTDGIVNATALQNALTSNTNVVITISGDSASLPASALTGAKDGAVVTISSALGTYSLPLSVLKLNDLAKALGINVADLSIKVSIVKVSGDMATAVNNALSALGTKALADVVDFNVVAVSKDGKSVTVDFGNTYVSRSLNLNAAADSTTATGVLYDSVTKKLTFVPSTFDGKVATLKRNGNSVYTVVSVNKSFSDISSSWAKGDIQLLANKLVIDGMTDTTFAPENNITRAQFAALAVRALGLSTVSGASTFSDVKSSDWYAAAVTTAAKAGLVNGYEDGTFGADKQITREELAALVVRALNYAGVKSNLSADQQASLLGKYSDANRIVWAKAEIAAAINAGIINGVTDTTVASSKQATRAESATMLKRFLSKAGFIN